MEPVAAANCGDLELAPMVISADHQVTLGGTRLGTWSDERGALERSVFDELTDQQRKYLDLHAAAGDTDPPGFHLNLLADRRTPLRVIEAVTAAYRRAEGRRVDLVFATPSDEWLWTRPAQHRRGRRR